MEPLDTSNLAEYINRAVSKGHNRPVLGFPAWPDAYNGFKTWSAQDLGTLADRSATFYAAYGLKARQKGESPLLVAIFAPGTIEWAATFFALARMGHAVLVLSSRLPDDVVAALLQKAGCRTIIHERHLELGMPVVSIPMISSTRLSQNARVDGQIVCDVSVIDVEADVCHVCHSSGSTGIPKLFPLTHQETTEKIRNGAAMWTSKGGWVASALYNVVGLRMLISCLVIEHPIYYDNDRLALTTDGLVSVMNELQPQQTWLTPYSLGLIAAKPEGIKLLKRSERVVSFGAVCPQALGDKVVKAGIRFSSTYGMSEVSSILTSVIRPPKDQEWDWLLPVPAIDAHLDFRLMGSKDSAGDCSDTEELYDLVILPTYPGLSSRFANCDDPPGSFATGDLFLKHPTKSNRWKLVGRKDDQVKIYQGHRRSIVNALVYEDTIKRGNEDIVDEVVLFGQGRSKLGVLVFAQHAEGSARDVVTERVWASINHDINGKLRTGIGKDMIVVVAGEAVVPRTVKLNFIRPQVYMRYQDLIDAAYDQGKGKNGMNGVY